MSFEENAESNNEASVYIPIKIEEGDKPEEEDEEVDEEEEPYMSPDINFGVPEDYSEPEEIHYLPSVLPPEPEPISIEKIGGDELPPPGWVPPPPPTHDPVTGLPLKSTADELPP